MNHSETSPRPRRYQRISFDDARELAEAWQASGLSRAAFARKRGLDVKMVYRWLSRVDRQIPSTPQVKTFIPVADPTRSNNDFPVWQLVWTLPHDEGFVRGPASELAHLMRLYMGTGAHR